MIAVADSLKGRSFTRVADWSREELVEDIVRESKLALSVAIKDAEASRM